MAFLLLVLTVYGITVVAFWLPGLVFGLMLTPRVYFPLRLAAEMAAMIMVAVWFLGHLAIAFPVAWMNYRFSRRPDYRLWLTVLAGLVISSIAITVTYLAGFALAPVFLE